MSNQDFQTLLPWPHLAAGTDMLVEIDFVIFDKSELRLVLGSLFKKNLKENIATRNVLTCRSNYHCLTHFPEIISLIFSEDGMEFRDLGKLGSQLV